MCLQQFATFYKSRIRIKFLKHWPWTRRERLFHDSFNLKGFKQFVLGKLLLSEGEKPPTEIWKAVPKVRLTGLHCITHSNWHCRPVSGCPRPPPTRLLSPSLSLSLSLAWSLSLALALSLALLGFFSLSPACSLSLSLLLSLHFDLSFLKLCCYFIRDLLRKWSSLTLNSR